ncbi:MAG: M20/M25/M40 family metallo-hydrolase [Gemmatimonadota bacterium]
MRRHLITAALLAAILPATLPAQSAKEIKKAAELITPKAVLERISVIADDSMGGRNTPSAGLEKVAIYLADNYKKWGLLPAGENGGYFQRYTMVKRAADLAASYLEVDEMGTVSHYRFDKWAFPTGPMTGLPISGPVRILAGTVTPATIAPLTLTGQVVLWVQDGARAADNNLLNRALVAKAPAAILILTNQDLTLFNSRMAQSRTGGRGMLEGFPVSGVPTLTMHDSIFAGDPQTANRPNWHDLRVSKSPVVMDAPDGVSVTLLLKDVELSRFTAPNVVAMVPGSDPLLKQEYVVFSGHMDHVGTADDGVGGCRPFTRPDNTIDTICNGADDDASGTTGIFSIAEAMAKLKHKPKRSIVFLNVSGEEKGLLGSAWYAAHPTLPMDKVIADINMDMIGRNATDSIVVIGKEHSDLGVTLAGVQKQHPELKLVAADDIWPEENFYSRSDHFNFAKKGVPVLFFFNGTHPQYHRADDEVKLIDTSKLARVAKLGFYFGVEIANRAVRPKWNPESYQLIVVEGKTPPAVKKAGT